MKKLTSLCCILLLCSKSLAINAHFFKKNTKLLSSNSIYKIILPIMQFKTRLPIALPPSHLINSMLKFDITLQPDNIHFIRHNAYSINLDASRDCDGAPICSIGNMYAAKISKRLPKNLFQKFPFNMQQLKQLEQDKTPPLPHHQKVKLSHQITGYVEKTPTREKAPPIFSTITWLQDDTVFQLTLKTHNRDKIIALANATVNNYFDSKNFAASLAK